MDFQMLEIMWTDLGPSDDSAFDYHIRPGTERIEIPEC